MNKVRLDRLEKAVNALPRPLFELICLYSEVWSDERKSQIFLRSLCDSDFLLLSRWLDGMDKRAEELFAQGTEMTGKKQEQWLDALPDEDFILLWWQMSDELNSTPEGRARLRDILRQCGVTLAVT